MKKHNFLPIVSFAVTSIILLIIFVVYKYAPFGKNSFASADAIIQYVDFFEYYKDVLVGKNSIIYTFTTGLGQTNIANFHYYLASPINLLIFFFDKNDIFTFYNVVSIIKLSLCSFVMSFYLSKRFNNIVKPHYITILSMCYAFMTYNMQSLRNIMYLDGIYMLPFISYSLYLLVKKNNVFWLSITIGLSILFNWYSAGINCLLTIFIFIVELSLYVVDNSFDLKEIIKKSLLYAYAMITGLMMSLVIFLPTILSLRQGRGGRFEIDMLTNTFNNINFVKQILNYSIGTESNPYFASIFAGMIVMLLIIGLLLSKINIKKRIIYISVLVFIFLIFHWQILSFAFCLFKAVSSYHFRYAYVGSFLFIYLSSFFLLDSKLLSENKNKLLVIAIVYSLLLVLFNNIFHMIDSIYMYFDVLFLIATSILLWLDNKDSIRTINVFSILLVIVVGAELIFNFVIIAVNRYSGNFVDYYNDYYSEYKKQIDYIIDKDDDEYRISETSYRDEGGNNIYACYNDSMALNYKGITQYTSSAEKLSMDLLKYMGYRAANLDIMTIANTSILPVDSLLGVKYIVSGRDIKGLTELTDYPITLNRKVYQNSFSFPMAFKMNGIYSDMSEPFFKASFINDANSFEYVNSLYKEIFKINDIVFKPLNFEKKIIDNKNLVYDIDTKDIKGPIYCSLPCNDKDSLHIDVNGKYMTDYACLTSPFVFDIPHDDDKAYIELKSNSDLLDVKEYFYYVDLDVLNEVSKIANNNKPSNINVSNGKVFLDVNSIGENDLFLSIPRSNGWEATVNGVPTYIYKICGGLMGIELYNGDNHVELIYKMPGQDLGILLSIIGIILLFMPKILNQYICRKMKQY